MRLFRNKQKELQEQKFAQLMELDRNLTEEDYRFMAENNVWSQVQSQVWQQVTPDWSNIESQVNRQNDI